jgi:hypothetical protein
VAVDISANGGREAPLNQDGHAYFEGLRLQVAFTDVRGTGFAAITFFRSSSSFALSTFMAFQSSTNKRDATVFAAPRRP